MMDWYGDSGGMGAGGWLMMVLVLVPVWALLVLGCAALYRTSVRGGSPSATLPVPERRHGALDILEERYARGEIDAAELTARRDILTGR